MLSEYTAWLFRHNLKLNQVRTRWQTKQELNLQIAPDLWFVAHKTRAFLCSKYNKYLTRLKHRQKPKAGRSKMVRTALLDISKYARETFNRML